MQDVIIIGRGPAGLSASLYTVRAGLGTLVVGKHQSSLLKAGKIENYFGFSQPVSGEFLLHEGEKQADGLGVELVDDNVVAISKDDFFTIKTSNASYEGKVLLLATGKPPRRPKLSDLERFEGRGISYCTTCDGFFYKGLKVGVLGFKDYAVHEALELQAFTKDITIYTNGRELELSGKYAEDAGRFHLDARAIGGFGGEEFLERIIFADGTYQNLDGVFIADENASSVDFARQLGIIIKDGDVAVDSDMSTNIEGIFAAGDCTGGFKQVSVAVGQGALAGRRMVEYVRRLK